MRLNSVTKRKVKLTTKALLCKIGDLEKTRKSKLSKAAELKRTLQELLFEPGNKAEIEISFNKYQVLLNDAKAAHNALLKLLPVEETEKHEIWFKAKLLGVDEVSWSVIFGVCT